MKLKLLGCLSLFLSVAAVLRGAALPPEKLLPADTLLFLTVPDAARYRSNFQASAHGKLLADPAMKPIQDKFLARFKTDFTGPVERELGLKLSDLGDLAQGQATFALFANPAAGTADPSPGWVLVVDARDKSEQLKTILADAQKRWTNSGKMLRTEKIRDLEFTTLVTSNEELGKVWDDIFKSKSSSGEKPQKKKIELTLGQVDSLLVLGDSPASIEKIVARQTGGVSASLASDASYAATHNALFRDADFFGWANAKTILGLVAKSPSAAREQMGVSTEKALSLLGLDALRAISVSHRETSDGSTVQFFITLPQAERTGLFKIISLDKKDALPPAFVPATAVKFTRTRVDLQKSWNAFEKTLTDAVPSFGGALKLILESAGTDKDSAFNARRDFLGNLGDDIITYQKPARSTSVTDLADPPAVYLIGSPNPEKLARAIALTVSSVGQQTSAMTEREFSGRKIYTLAAAPGGADAKGLATMNISFGGGYAAFSKDVPALEEFLQRVDAKDKSLLETPGLVAASEKAGGAGNGFLSFENQRDQMKTLFEVLKSSGGSPFALLGNPLLGAAVPGADENAQKLKDWVDFSLLPPFDAVAKYYSFGVTVGSSTPEGLGVKFFSPKP